MSGVYTAIAVGGSAVLGAVVNTNNSNKAINAETNAANQANQTQWNMFQQEQGNAQPWLQAGQAGLTSAQNLINNPSSFQFDPGYQFSLNQGTDAINRQTANRGGMLAGSTLGALDQFSQGLANQNYGSAINRYLSLAGLGQTAVGQTNQAGMNAGNIISGNLMNLGAGQGAAALAQGNNLTGLLNNGTNQFMNYQLMNGLMGTNGGSTGQGFGIGNYGGSGFGNSVGSAGYWNSPGNTYTGYGGTPIDVGIG